MTTESQVRAAAKVIAASSLIDAPKLPAEAWMGLARSILDAAANIADIEAKIGPDHPTCRHTHYSFEQHGRRCDCGTLMTDPGD